MKKFILFIFGITAPFFLSAQIGFSDMSVLLPQNNYSGIGVSIADMNGDGKDDIIQLNQGNELRIQYQTSGIFNSYAVGTVALESQWMMAVADIDNNGFNDVMAGGRYDQIKTYHNTFGIFTSSTIPNSAIFCQAGSFNDINNDGWADAFNCHDDGESQINVNDGLGNLVPGDFLIDMTTTPFSDNSGNYGMCWTDFDNDGDVDLYIAKCRQGVGDPSDPRRINALYEQTSPGVYTENSAAYNLKLGDQSWTADFADVDNDGDMDCFMLNHDVPSAVYYNENGTFVNGDLIDGINIGIFPLQAILEDFNNDGFVDIIASGTGHQYFQNDGDGTFTEISGLFDANSMHTFAIGDLNTDGFLDVYAGYGNVYTTPSATPDKLWMNNGNANNYFTVRLTGTTSTKNALGARVTIYSALGKQIREVRSGEGYGVSHSFLQHFGLGTDTQIDSMIINYPSGQKDYYYALPVNQFFDATEGDSKGPESNHKFSDASDFPTAGINGEDNLTFGDIDWYKINTGINYGLKVQLLCLAVDYNVEVYNSSQTLIMSGTNSGTAPEKLQVNFLEQFTDYYIKVFGNGTDYNLLPYCLHITKTESFFQSEEEEELETLESMEIFYPNPARSTLNIRMESSGDLRIYDTQGRLIKNIPNFKSKTLDISTLSSGIYFIELNTAEGLVREKLLVK